jgi:hypothetical protein
VAGTATWRVARAVALALTAALSSVGPVTPASAAGIGPLDIYPRIACVFAPASAGTSIKFDLFTSGGALRGSVVEEVQAGDDGAFGCFDVSMRPGDRVRVTIGTDHRSVRVERLTLRIDRVADVVTGAGPAGKRVRVIINRCLVGTGFNPDFCPRVLARRVRVGEHGYRLDTTGRLDLRGHDLVTVEFRVASGDRFKVFQAVPVFFIDDFQHPFVSGRMPTSAPVRFRLLATPGGQEIARTSVRGESVGTFKDLGVEVPVRAGNQVVGAFAADAKMKIPDMTATVDSTNDTYRSRCFPSRQFVLQIFGAGGGEVRGVTDAHGKVDIDVAAAGLDMAPGDGLRLRCIDSRGDSIDASSTAP